MKTSPSNTDPNTSRTTGNDAMPQDETRKQQNSRANSEGSRTASRLSAQSDKQRRELWMYLAVTIIAMELFIFVAALFFAFISSGTEPLKFPWLSWAATAVGIPSVLLVSVHLAVGLFTSSARQDEEWQRHLPERLQKAYTIIKRAPAMVLLLGLIAIGAALFTIDGAFQLLENFFVLFKPYILHILIGLGIVIILLGLGAFWFNYRTRKLYADYEYRRAVFEKTGLIIVDKNTALLSGDRSVLTPIAAESAKALPQGEPTPPGDPANSAHGKTSGTTGTTAAPSTSATHGALNHVANEAKASADSPNSSQDSSAGNSAIPSGGTSPNPSEGTSPAQPGTENHSGKGKNKDVIDDGITDAVYTEVPPDNKDF